MFKLGNNIFSSILIFKFIKNLIKKGFLNINIFLTLFKSLKFYYKVKPKLFLFLIIEKLKLIFNFFLIGKKKKKSIPYLLDFEQKYFHVLKLLSKIEEKNIKNFILNQFKIFLNKKNINRLILKKKKTYLIFLKNKRYLKC